MLQRRFCMEHALFRSVGDCHDIHLDGAGLPAWRSLLLASPSAGGMNDAWAITGRECPRTTRDGWVPAPPLVRGPRMVLRRLFYYGFHGLSYESIIQKLRTGGDHGTHRIAPLAAHAPLLLRRQLSDDWPDLFAGESAAARVAAAGTHQTPVAGTLGNLAWPQLHLRAPDPPDPGHGCQRDLPHRPGTRRPRDRRERLPGRDLLRDLSAR